MVYGDKIARNMRALKAQNNAKQPFIGQLMLRGRRSAADNVSREGQALAAFRFATQPGVDVIGTLGTAAHRSTQIFFPDSITHANDHGLSPMIRFTVNAN